MPEAFESLYQLLFISFAIALVLLERIGALQRERVVVASRWTSNVGLYLIGSVVGAIALPIGIYAFAAAQPPGVLARIELPFAAQLALTFVILDFAWYWEHRLLHRLPLLWRLHLVHHSDTQVDVTTTERHHPLEVLFSTAFLAAVVAALRFPAEALGSYLICAAAISLYSHANLRLAAPIDRWLNWLVVTAPVHAVHHSDLQAQTDSNYGTVLTIWDRLFGTYVDPHSTTIAHFGLGYFHRPSDTRLARVLRQPFLYRRDLDYPARDSAPVDAPAESSAPRFILTKNGRDALAGAIAGCILVTIVMWPTLTGMVASWRSEPYQYAWLVMPMLVYLLVWHRASEALDPRPDFSGVFVVIAAALCWSAADLMNIDVGREFALVLSLQGVAMSALGWRSYWRWFPTLALMFLMVPCGDLVQPLLRVLTLRSIELFAVLANLPHSLDGFIIHMGTHRYIVIDDCSGLSYATLATFLGYCFGLLLYRSLWKIVAMASLGAALGILTNVIRVNSIVLIDWIRGSQMDLMAHGAIQWLALLAALGLLFYVLSRLAIDEPPVESISVAPAPAQPVRKFAPVIAGLSGLLIAGSAAGLPTRDSLPAHRGHSVSFPQNLSGWMRVDPAPAWTADPNAGIESIRLGYRRDGREFQLLIVEARSPNAKLAESALAPGDPTVWREKQARNRVDCEDRRCSALLHSAWQRDKTQQVRHAYFAYTIGGLVTDSRLALRAVHGWHRLIGDRDTPRLIAFVSDDPAPDIRELANALERVQDALGERDAR